jgi:hypothetical protein
MSIVIPTITKPETIEGLQSLDLLDLFSDVYTEQESIKDTTGKYTSVLMITDENGVSVSIHEYVCPDDTAGFQVFVSMEVEEKIMSKSFGVGSEADSRSNDWVERKEEEEYA